ncbi:MAG TPA: alginate lyase family protein [Polyangiaceae bacterium]|nr:alginate lyase family protein [Polyangiaceae bacterium]
MNHCTTASSLVAIALLGLVACSGTKSSAGPDDSGGSAASESSSSGRTGLAPAGSGNAMGGTASESMVGASGGTAGVLDATDAGVTMTNGFVHPGILVSKGMLDFVKAKLAVGSEPWKDAFARASSDDLGKIPYTPHPIATVECGAYSDPDIGCTDEKQDADAAYTQALLWYHTGDQKYADSAINIMNQWASTIKAHTNSNAPLQSAWVAEVFPRAAEIIRYSNAGWAEADIDAFATMLSTVYLPEVVNGADSNGNWELSMAEATMNIGVFTNDQDVFEQGVSLWRKRTPAYVYLSTDGATPVPPPKGSYPGDALIGYWYNQSTFVDGLCQETCRDLGHVQYGLAALINAAETARIQGVDLVADEQKRISAALEFHAQYINGTAVPSWLCGGALNAVTPDPMWEIGYNQYATTLGLALPKTETLVMKQRPSAADHHMVWETLSHGAIGSVGLP